jgi:hypothetical protein
MWKAGDERITKRTHESVLSTSWTTLYELVNGSQVSSIGIELEHSQLSAGKRSMESGGVAAVIGPATPPFPPSEILQIRRLLHARLALVTLLSRQIGG